MNKLYSSLAVIFLLATFSELSNATEPRFNMSLANFITADSICQFDIYLLWTNASDTTCDQFEFGTSRIYVTFDSAWLAGQGVITVSKVLTGLPPGSLPPALRNINVKIIGNTFYASPNVPDPKANFIVSNVFPGTPILRVRVSTNKHCFLCNVAYPNFKFKLNPPQNTFVEYFTPSIESKESRVQTLVPLLDTINNLYYVQENPILCRKVVLYLTSFIEGFYNKDENKMIGDSVAVSIRQSTAPYAIVQTLKDDLDSAGKEYFVEGGLFTSYYVAVKHRNSIETWSSNPLMFFYGNNNYDFSTASSKAFGNNMKLIDDSPVRYGFYSGDVVSDGAINLTDVIAVYNDANAFATGYINSDVTGDNITNLDDLLITSNNANAFITKITP